MGELKESSHVRGVMKRFGRQKNLVPSGVWELELKTIDVRGVVNSRQTY
jgi:hypothetical protein